MEYDMSSSFLAETVPAESFVAPFPAPMDINDDDDDDGPSDAVKFVAWLLAVIG